MFIYMILTFFFFLGASILPTITSEITGSKGMSSTFGVLFTGATIAGAIAPTIFGYLADTFNFNVGFIFLGTIAVFCFIIIYLFKLKFNETVNRMQ